MTNLSAHRMMSIGRSIPDSSEGSEGHDEDGDHAIDRRHHRMALVVVRRMVRLEDDEVSCKENK
jgi:hypothetical protein